MWTPETSDIEISGNEIVDATGVAIKLVNADRMLVQNNTLINPLSGLDREEKLEFCRGIPQEVVHDVMRNPSYSIATISTGHARGSVNRAENTPPA